ncbi:MAG: hypothetical protein K2X48_10915 [Chitinophagaceae bacterium]|nr:hypothetical protein [Chitinophagaceae bacterium]
MTNRSVIKKKFSLRYLIFLVSFTVITAVLLIHYFEYNRLNQLFENSSLQKDTDAVAIHKFNIGRTQYFGEYPGGSFYKHFNNLGFVKNDSTNVKKDSGVYRVLITGDSHTDGVIASQENFCTLLQDSLTKLNRKTEVLNAGVGYYSFENYAGVIKRNLYLQPDEYVIMVYTGNDFIENLMYNYHWYNPVQSLRQFRARLGWRYQYPLMYNNQSLTQVLYFYFYPYQKQHAVDIAEKKLDYIDSLCKAHHIKLTLAFIPTQYDISDTLISKIKNAYGFSDSVLQINRWFTQSFINYCSAKKIVTYDLFQQMKSLNDTLYYPKDHHLNQNGNKAIARFMLPHFLN